MKRSASSLRVFFATLSSLATLAGILFVTAVVGPAIESRYWPVLSKATFSVVHRGAGRMTIDWTATRHRGTCQFVSVVALVRRGDDWHAAVLSRAEDETDAPLAGTTRPTGLQRFTRLDVIPDGQTLRMVLRHRCHPLWLTVTQLPDAELSP